MSAVPLPQTAEFRPARSTARSVRRRLLVLVLSIALPMTGISVFAAYTIYAEQRRAITTAALETARALSLVADREVAYRAGVLRTLAASEALDRGDLRAFYDQARVVCAGTDMTLVVSNLAGEQLVNTRLPFGETAPRIPLPSQSASTSSFSVSNLYLAPISKQYSFAVRLPVVREGQPTRYVISMGSHASTLRRIFDQQRLPKGWTGTLVDSTGRVLARNMGGDEMIGRSATPDMLRRLSQPQGMHETLTLDGTPVITVFARAPESSWSVLIGLPRASMRRAALEALAAMMGVTVVLSGLGLWAAVRVGRGIAEPLRRLREDADRLGRGELLHDTATGLSETDDVQHALATASRRQREADAEMNRRVEQAVAESERAQQMALGVQKIEALGRLTAGIAHDFNNLLQTMSTGIRMATLLASDDRARNALSACERAVAKAVTLTRQLMTFGASQPGLLKVVDLGHHLPLLDELLRGALDDSITLRMDIDGDTWAVQLDPVQFELAVLNLALNARDAITGTGDGNSPRGHGGTVTITASNCKLTADEVPGVASGDYVAVSVGDDGCGIEPAVMSRVFEPFFTTKPVGRGTGLGLAQVFGFAKQLGGGVRADSQPGRGTLITMVLPAFREQLPAAVVSQAASTLPPRHEGCVLLVEDDALVRGLTAEALESLGFTVLVASDVNDALAIARSREAIDAVLSDVVMPGGKSGIDLVEALREIRPGLPVLLASGYAEHLDRAIAVPVIAKPYDVQAVAQQLSMLMVAAND